MAQAYRSGMAFIQNVPIPVEMAGWRSDTYELQKHGWEISAKQNMTRMCIQIALHHPASGLYAISMVEDLDFLRPERAEMLRHMVIHINNVGTKVLFQHTVNISQEPMSAFKPVDTTPHIIETKISSLEDLVVFRPLPKEIIVAPDNVPSLMDKILALQDPKMKKLMSEQRKRDARATPKIESHCQIISIAS